MSPEAQRIAIAESVGIHLHDGDHAPSNYVFTTDLPDYLNDLNAMHEAEKVLTYEQFDEYYVQLSMKMVRPFHATAAQRAKAYLRTIGKWEGGSDD